MPEQPETPQEPEKTWKLEEVRAVLKAKRDRGYVEEVKTLLKAHGADELYCGYMDGAWRQLYGGDATISRRQGRANIASPEALAELVPSGLDALYTYLLFYRSTAELSPSLAQRIA